MKPFIYLMTLSLLFISCKKDEHKTTFNKTILGGCFNKEKKLKSTYAINANDTCFSYYIGDTIIIHYGFNYYCSAVLNKSIASEVNKIDIKISDDCKDGCNSYCMCYYTYDFKFLKSNFDNSIDFTLSFKGASDTVYSIKTKKTINY